MMTQTPVSSSFSLFLSYAHEDEEWLNKLRTHMSLLRRQGIIVDWYDRQIVPGTNWSMTIDQRLEQASLILLLVSADFLASDYSYQVEMQRALQLHEAGRARVIPIAVRPSDWTGAPFAHLQALPTDARPLSTWDDEDAALKDVVAEIRRVIESVPLSVVSTSRTSLPFIPIFPASNLFFTGREEILQQLYTRLQQSQIAASGSIQTLSGLGGIGKTQLAIAYAYLHQQDYQAILWAIADTVDTLNASYIEIARHLSLPEKDEKERAVIVNAVKTWLQTHRGWLLILDNADDPNAFLPFLPQRPAGHIVITTRASDLSHLGHGIDHSLLVEVFSEEQGIFFLLRRAGLSNVSPRDRHDALQIIQELGALPLALDQAGAYIQDTSTTLKDYLQIYQQNSRGHRGLLGENDRQDYRESVATTWNISFQKVKKRNPAAADLLLFCAFLAPDQIPEELLDKGSKNLGRPLFSIATDKHKRNLAIKDLKAYSLIVRHPQTKMLSIHRLVQEVVRDSLPIQKSNLWIGRVFEAIDSIFPLSTFDTSNPNADLDYWPTYERLIPHVLICADQVEQASVKPEGRIALLLTKAGWYLQNRGRFEQAEPYYERAYKLQANSGRVGIPLNHEASLTLLSQLYVVQGQYGKAEALFQQVQDNYEQQFGTNSPLLLNIWNYFGGLYLCQGRYAKAESYLLRAKDKCKEELGGINSSSMPAVLKKQATSRLETLYASVLNNLATAYREQGRYAEAEHLYQQSLNIRRDIFGAQHPSAVGILNNLATLYCYQGNYEQAESWYLQVLALRRKLFGDLHPETTNSENDLANLYCCQGRYKEAEGLYNHALEIRKELYGTQDFRTAESLNGLATLYCLQGRYEQAEPLCQQALTIRQQRLGFRHPDTAKSWNDLATLCRDQGRYPEAKVYYDYALEIRKELYSTQDFRTAESLNGLATLYCLQERYEEAEKRYHRALTIRKRRLGSEHPATAQSLHGLATLYCHQRKYEQAESLYQQALKIRAREPGAEHPDMAESLNGLATLYCRQEKYKQAEPLYQRALSICKKCLSQDHPLTLKIDQNYARLLRTLGREDEAKHP